METQLLKSRFEWIWNKLARCPWSTQKADYRTGPSHLGGTIGVCTRRERHRTGKSGSCLVLQKHISFILLFSLHLIFFSFSKNYVFVLLKKKKLRKTQGTWKSHSFIFGSALLRGLQKQGSFFDHLPALPARPGPSPKFRALFSSTYIQVGLRGQSPLWSLQRACMLSRIWLCDPRDCNPPGSSANGIFQARILEVVAISYSRESSQLRGQTSSPELAGGFFSTWTTTDAPCGPWWDSKRSEMERGLLSWEGQDC